MRVWERGAGITLACGTGPVRRTSRESAQGRTGRKVTLSWMAANSGSNGARATITC